MISYNISNQLYVNFMATTSGVKVKNINKTSTKQAPLTLESLITIGDALRDKGKLNEASEFYYKSLYSREKAFGADHPSTLEAVQSLALLLEMKKNFSEAENMYIRFDNYMHSYYRNGSIYLLFKQDII